MLVKALHDLAASGITTFMEANTQTPRPLTRTSASPARTSCPHGSHSRSRVPEPHNDEEFSRLKDLRKLAESQPQLRADVIKLFEDGVMEFPSQTAAMLEPYLEANGKPGKNSRTTLL